MIKKRIFTIIRNHLNINPELNSIKKLQDLYLNKEEKQVKNLIVFIIPPKEVMSGGIMSIFNIAFYSRQLYQIHQSEVILATIINIENETHYKQNYFENDEKIFRFEQILEFKNLEKLIIHIPEFLVKNFYRCLPSSIVHHLLKIKTFKINILNQNINLMPKKKIVKKLARLSMNITQTCAHLRYAKQSFSDLYEIPVLLLLPYFKDFFKYVKKRSFSEKEDIIVYSPDQCRFKNNVLAILKKRLKHYKFIEINNITFKDYMDIISRAKYTITFGEGMDGYLFQPFFQGSIAFAVYNEDFFPSGDYLELMNIFENYEEMSEKLLGLILSFDKNPMIYERLNITFLNRIRPFIGFDKFMASLKKFYLNQFDFYPNKSTL